MDEPPTSTSHRTRAWRRRCSSWSRFTHCHVAFPPTPRLPILHVGGNKKRKADVSGTGAGSKKRKASSGKVRSGKATESSQRDAVTSEQVHDHQSGAVVVRWVRHDGSQAKLTLPVPEGDTATPDNLAADCSPVGFGYLGENVLDESVGRAGVMDRSRFSSKLDPYALGIVDCVARPACTPSDSFTRAERYKLHKS
ncbi:hypothetical protein PWT90_07468 [Aphanocladium album]|nr:hypothetical protein PWT90_07468 [Aphanocladium album]